MEATNQPQTEYPTLMIEMIAANRANVTVNDESIDVANALLMLELARLNIMSYHVSSGDEEPTSTE